MAERPRRLAGMSPEKLQRLIDSLRGSSPTAAAAPAILPRRPGLDRLPLSFSQERLWFLDRLDPGSPAFNLPAAVELKGELYSAALAAALAEVVRRHESLRTAFAEEDGAPVQRVVPPGDAPFTLPRIDLTALPEETRQHEAARLASLHAAWRFDLARGPLLTAALLRLSDRRHHLLLAMHHIVSDGWSMGILIREVAALYGAFVEGRPSPLPELPLQYPDFALWQRETAATLRERDLTWWSERLSGQTAPLDLPADRPRPAVQTWRGGWVIRTLPADLSDRLRSFGQAEGATLFMTMLAGVQALLHRLAGSDDVVVGSPIAGRRMAETEPLIGFFLNLLALRTDISGDPGFRELVARVREVTLGAYAHQDLPFEALLARLQPERDLSRTPLFQVLFNLLNFPLSEQRLPGLAIEAISLPDLPSKFDLTFYVRDDPGQGIAVRMAYNADLFDAVRMEELVDQLELLLAEGVESPELGVDRISLAVTPRARAALPDPAAELSAAWEGAVHEVFAGHAGRTPGALAAADPAESWTYGEMDERSDRLAAFLQAGGVRPGDVVAFWAHRSAPLVWGVLGAQKAGAAFLMLDPRYPAPRQAQMLGIARPAAWLQVAAAGPVPAEIESELDAIGCACRLTLPARSDDPDFLADGPAGPTAVEVGPDDVAYVAFTSGSTGVPKGVLGRHGSLSHFIPWLRRRFELTAGDRFSLLSGLAHDPLHRDLFTPLQIGAAVVIPDPDTMDEPGRLAAWMRREGVTVAHLTPALGQVLTTEAPNRPRVEVPSLRCVFLVGDVLTRRDVARLRRLAPAVTCVNYYGSTETQRAVGYHVAQEDEPREVLPLGRGIPDVQLLVRNPSGALAGIGELGEISVRSPHIALGYLGDPELTAQRFADDLYRTGDLGRYLPNGEAVFVGRADTQVKIRGFRIELGEIESVLGGFPGVREAVVIARQDRGAELYLAAYVVPAPGAALAARELRAYLRERLPDSMVPATFTLLDELPLTPNRKVDRKALPAPDRGAEDAAFVAPETDLEREIAAVWREVLGVDRVGIHDNFFEIGGHSLLLVRLHSRLQEALKADLSLMDLFSHPNVHAQAEHLRGRGAGARRDPLPARRSPSLPGGRIAIVGLAGRFPGARDLEAFWQNLRQGVESVSFFSEEELLESGVPSELLRHPSYVPARAVVDGEDLFDAAFFEIPPRQAELMDPQLRFFLETAWHALESAGIDPGRYPGAIGLYGGVTASSYLLSNLLSHPGLLQEIGPGPLLLGTDRDFLTTQVSYRLGLRGPSVDVQTACSTSLVATHLACQALLTGDCDVALAGGVSIKVPQRTGYVYQESGPDSSDGHCRAFDARADGSIYGAGVGLVVLKRLEDALADGDAIHAVILGTAINNDGSQKVGYTAPSIEGQAAVVAAALDRAGVEPGTIDYVECHGSGTALGDPIEVTALTRAFGGTGKKGSCAIGSVKTNIGHLGAAAGVTGLIKTVLALENREIPPSLNFETPNPKIDFAASPFRVNHRLSAWPANGRPRRAGVSSLGQGGTNAHVVLEEAPAREPSGPSRPWQLLVLSARTATALEAATENLAAWLEGHPEASLADAAFTLQVGRRGFAHRRAVVCRGVDEARRILEERDPRRLLTGVQDGGRRPVAFLLSGVGDHYPGMARGLYETEPVFRAALDRCFEVLADGPWRDLREAVFAGLERTAEGGLDLRRMLGRGDADEAARRLHRTLYAQPAVFAVEYALAQLWMSWGVEPEALLGYSLGEYVAACLAGVFPLEDALPLVAERARWIEELPAGAMLAVPLPEDEARARLSPGLDVAAVNGPQLSVVSGPPEEVAALAGRLAEEGIAARQLPTTHAFHSRGMEPLAERLTERVRRLRPAAPRIPLLSNVTGTWLTTDEATDPAYWARHLSGPVRFSDGLAELWKNPSRVLLEVGPGQGLSALALQHPAAGRGRIALPSLPHAHERQDDAAFLFGTLGRLWLAGAAIDWAGLWREERRHRLELPLYPFERRRFWVEPSQSERVEPALLSSALQEEQTPAPAPPALSLHERPRLPTAWEAPRNETEAWVAGQIERLLGIAGVGAHDSFFELGGHSLLGTRLLSRLRDELGVELSIAALFESPTPAELAARIESARGGAPEAEPIERLPRTGPTADLPLSFTQERLWFLDQLEPGSAAYNIPIALRLEGLVDAAALAGALSGVARRHETLRTTFPTVDGVPVQRIAPPGPFPLAVIDLSGLPEAAREAEGARLAVEEPRAPFDLANGPLARASLVRLGERGHLLLATQHHIISDGWSLGLFVREVTSLYRAFTAGEAPALPALPVQYADFSSWQRRQLSGPALARQMAWWRERLTPPPPVLTLPTDRPRPAVETFRGGREPLAVPPELTAALAALGREQDATLFMTLLAGFTALLGRLAGQEDLAVGSPIAGRTRAEVEGLIGVFINTLVLRTSLAGDPTFREVVARVRETALGAYAHQELPFERLVQELRPERSLGHSPLFQVLFILQNLPLEDLEAPGLTLRPIEDVYHGVARFDLTLSATETEGGLRGYLEFKTDLFDAATAARWLGHLGTLLTAAAAEPGRRLSELLLLSDAEQRQVLKPPQSALPLSFAQERLWFLDRLEPGSPAYNLPLAVGLTGSLDPGALAAALAEVVRRHEALRTTFALSGGRPVQVVGPPRPVALPQVDLAALPEPFREGEAKALADTEAARPFDLAAGPLLRGLLLRLDGREHRLVVVLHHIVADGWSLGVLVRETAALYEAARRGRPSPLPELPLQYAGYAAWQRSWLTREVLDGLVDHWRARLAGAPALLALPTDRPRPRVQRLHGARLRVDLARELVAGLREAGRKERATLFMTLLAGLTAWLTRYGAGTDLPVGAPVAGRNRTETEGLIGLLLNTVVLRCDLRGDPAFGDLVARLREVTIDAYAHQELPFERLVEALVPRRDLSHSPLFQVMLALQEAHLAEPLGEGSDLVLTPLLDLEETAAKLDLSLNLTDTPAGLTGSWRYNRDLFDPPTAARMLRHLQTLLAGAAANPRLRVSELPVLSAAESAQLAEWNHTGAGWPLDACLHERIEAQVERTPGAIAVSFEGEEITYRELNRRANRLAWRLRELGVGPDVPVGISIERSLEMVVGLLAILKAGGAYVPLDPSYPAERLAFMLEDSAVPVLLTREELAGRLPAGSARIVAPGGEVEGPEENPESGAGPGNLAYIIYTSGSTGRPKGAMNTHRGIVNRLLWMQEAFGLGEDDRVLQKTPMSFDVSVWELFWPLMTGARLVVARPGAHGDPAYLVETIAGEGITTIHFVPSMLQVFVAAPGVERCRSLCRVIASGEALPGELPERLARRLPVPLFNLYGPTEAAVDVTWWACHPDGGRPVPIGRPIANTEVHLLDSGLRPVPTGVPGEIFLGGVNLARGYLRRPDLTAERFVPHPAGEPGERLYRTGDLGRHRPDGAIEFLGRLDHQVKIRGFRVELGEIEAALAAHPAVREAVVLAREEREDRAVRDLRLVAYVVPREERHPTLEELRGALAATLPDPMLPTALVVLDALPLNPSGKTDRAALERIDPKTSAPPEAEPERRDLPRTPVERFLAGLFRETLRLPEGRETGIHDSFFALGGNSIDAAVLVNRLQEELAEIVHVVVLFEAPSIAQLAAYLVREHPEAVSRLWRSPGPAVAAPGAPAGGQARPIDAALVGELRARIPAPRPAPRLAARNRPAVFVLSPPRSGSTLLRVLLGGHPGLFAPPELELLPYDTLAERRAAFPGSDAFRLEGLPRALMELRLCGPGEAQAALSEMEAQGMATGEVYRALQDGLGGRLLVDKTPSYTFHAGILRRAEALFDEPRYIHLIRNPYGMIRSFEEAKLDQIFLRGRHSFGRRELAELLWVLGHQNVMEHLREVPSGRQLWVRFEDLVREPERILREICAFLGLAYHPDMAEPYKDGAARMTDGLHAESRMLGDVKFHRHAGIDPGVADRWRDQVTEDFLGDVTRETAVALGYPLAPLAVPRTRRPAGEPEGWERIPRLRREPGEPLPLSFSQERLWFLDRLDPGTAAYNIPAALRLTGALDVPALTGSLREIVRRHEALRTRFALVDGRPGQIVEAAPRVELPVADLSGLPEAAREPEALRLAAAESAAPFDLERGPLLRATLLRLGADEHAALLTLHHIVADGWSMGLLVREVGALYPALVRGEASPLPEPEVQYADFAAWQRRWLSGERLAGLLAGWKERLAGAPAALELPADRPRPAVQTFRGGKVSFRLGEEAAAALREPARGEQLTPFMVLLAAFQALLFRHSGQEDLVVGTPAAGRNRREVEGLIGVFINSLPLRADLSGDPTWSELLKRTRERTLEAFARQDLPFEKLVEELQPARDLARPPVFQVMLAQQNLRSEGIELPGLRIAPLGATVIDAKLELTLSIHEESLAGQLEHNADLFERATAERMLGHFSTLLAGAAAGPGRRLSDLPLLTAAERSQLAAWNGTAEEVPEASVHELFAAQAIRTPEAEAVVCGGERLTYRELEERANRLAHHLRRLGVKAESLVGLSLERSTDLVVGLLGILKAGGAYLPLDPSYPVERLALVLEDSGAEVLVTSRALAQGLFADLPVRPGRLVLLDAEAEAIARLRPSPPASGADPGNLAYVLFTSGSTGRPKGVAVPHRALVSFLVSMRRAPGFAAGDRLLALTSLSFDIAGLEIWLPLLSGGCVELATREEAADGPALAARLAACGARVMQATPSTWRMLLDTGWEGDPRLSALCGGEALPRGLAAALRSRTGELWNLYGPTETTIWSSLLEIGAEEARGDGAAAIGRPIANTSLHVLDICGRPAAVGIPGELLIGGTGVTRGYLGRPDLTAERFVPAPSGEPGARLYRTGDLVRRRPDGALEFLGRLDHQVKVRGFRIELGEVEAALARHPQVAQAVAAVGGSGASARLTAHFVPRGPVDPAELRAFLAQSLPAYMVPGTFVEHGALPLTPNGKIDRKALARTTAPTAPPAAASPAAPAAAAPPAAPASPLEEAMAALWAEVLGTGRVGPQDDFFALGGHSILATLLMHRIRQSFGVDLPLRTLFAAPTVAGLAAAIAARRAEGGEAAARPAGMPRIVPDPEGLGLPFPLTDVQEAYWIGRSGALELGSVATHVYFELDATGLDLPRFENAVRRLVERHGMLRAIVQPDGRQRILPEVPPYRITTVDLSGADVAAAGEARLALRGHLSHQVLPSDRWPLFELAAARLPEGRMRLYVSIDMLIGDAWSLRLLGRDLGRLYEDPGAALPPLQISFRDYVLAEAALRETAAYRRDLDYWRGRLAEIPPAPQLPLAKSPAEVRTPHFVRRSGRLAPEAWSRLKEQAARAGLTPSGALLAAWSEVLAAWTGTSRLTLNLTLFNRLPLHPQVDELVGDFTSLTLLAVERRPGEPFVEQARRTQQRLWDDLDHRLVSGVRVLRELSRLGREPRTMMPVVFTSTLNQAARESRPADGEEMRSEDDTWGITQTPQVWLDHQVSESGGALHWKWDAVEELFPAGLLDDMFAAYGRLVERLAEGEEAWREPVRGLLPEAQLRILEEVNATAAPVPAGLLHEPFLEQARRTPEAPAVLTSSRTVTYGELDRLSRALAGRLQRRGARPNRLVAVVMHKGWEQVAAVLAVLRAGAAYLPLDARLPAERLRHLLARGEVAVALTQPGLEHSLPWPEGVERLVVDGALEAADEGPEPSAPLPAPEDLAYVIFTSGSTGEPKGVMIDHRGALNTVADVNRRFGVGPGDRGLALSSLSFDLSVWDVFGLLSAGGAVVVPDAGTERDPEHWAALASREGVTVWNTVPALMEMLVEHAAGRPGAPAMPLRVVLLSGDWIPVRLPGRIHSAFPGARVISLGGATEASIWSILYPVSEVGEGWASIPYGRPMDNQRFHVLDGDLEPAPVWVPGHLYIGGIGLARGYWRDEEKTAAAFLVHPRTGERLYRTGDLGRLLPSGDIEFLGRDDTQVKVQGHRIELGEIEAALARHPAVGAAVVSAVGEARGAKQLVAYVVLAGEQAAPSRPAVISDPVERLRFKLAHHNLRPDEGRPEVALRRPGLSPEQLEALYVRRRSYRRFLREPLPLDDLAGFLAGLAPVPLEGLPFPKHRYGSAGSLYPVQTYLHVKEGRVEGLAGGLYYHDPERHRLVLLAGEGGLDASLWDPVNRGVFEESAFAVFLIARLAAITPLYGERARHFAALEAGLMTQLLEMSAPDHGLGLAQMGGLRFDAVRARFALDETCELMHTLLGGRIAPEQARLAALQADMAEQRALLQLVEQQPVRAELPAAARSDAAVFAGLREHLRARLPEYMLPAHFVRIEEVPLSANGKVDRKALPAPEALEAEARPAAVPYAPPETETEQVVARLAAEVLGASRVGLYDNFFDLGANSVQMVRLHNALREALGAEIPIVEIFNHPSVSLLARRLSQSSGSREPEGTAAPDPGAERVERLREGKDWRRQRLQKRQAAGGL
ncbi:MAG TPA: amino acid adenylation domain-containing protein [Thermoanaerobaculia bacterium]|nr:amino acid adenylation domain-containing protein [Thermoanaerobaculia bacterium]